MSIILSAYTVVKFTCISLYNLTLFYIFLIDYLSVKRYSARMRTCEHCNSFIPEGIDECPNCRGQQTEQKTGIQKSAKKSFRLATQVLMAGAVSVTMMACYGAPPVKQCAPDLDRDSDGYYTNYCEEEAGSRVSSIDCNDQDATIYPGAQEITGDNIDQNCDGVAD